MDERDNPRSLAIVYVHGLLSSGAAWDEMDDLVKKDSTLAGIRTYRFDYRSSLAPRTLTRRTPTLDVVSDALSTFLEYNVTEGEVLLATHSQGGLVALRLLSRHTAASGLHSSRKVRGLILYACPQAGSSFAWLPRMLFRGHPQERSLRPLDPATAESVRTVTIGVIQKEAPFRDIRVKAVAGAYDGIVTTTSAKSMWPQVDTVAGDHSSIIRPTSPDDASFLILRRTVHEIAESPDSADDAAPNAPNSHWKRLADDLAHKLHFDDWDYAIGGLTRTSYSVPSEELADFYAASAWLLSRVYPPGQESLTRTLKNLNSVLIDLLDVFGRHTELPASTPPGAWIRVPRWYKGRGFNPKYDEDLRDYLEHVNLLTDLAFELTRASDWFCETFRTEIDPSWRLDEGGLTVESGPHQDGDTRVRRPQYSEIERNLVPGPYLGLSEFKETGRWLRDVHTPQPEDRTPLSTAERLDQELQDEQMSRLASEVDVYTNWRREGGRTEGLTALNLGVSSGLVSTSGYRVPIWETSLHLRFSLAEPDLRLSIETHGGRVLFKTDWVPEISTLEMFRNLDEAMRDLGEHLGPLLFSPARAIQDAVDSLVFAAKYRAQALRSGSEYFEKLIECVDGWYISEDRVFPREHPFYSITKDRLNEMDWESHISDKGWSGIHSALEVARPLLMSSRTNDSTAG